MIAIYVFEHYLNSEEKSAIVEEGKQPKTETNEYFLPTSTTGQMVHHQNYSLSYSEPHEQAEWVAYELKSSHLSSTNHKRPYFEIDNAVKSGAAHWRVQRAELHQRGVGLRDCGSVG